MSGGGLERLAGELPSAAAVMWRMLVDELGEGPAVELLALQLDVLGVLAEAAGVSVEAVDEFRAEFGGVFGEVLGEVEE